MPKNGLGILQASGSKSCLQTVASVVEDSSANLSYEQHVDYGSCLARLCFPEESSSDQHYAHNSLTHQLAHHASLNLVVPHAGRRDTVNVRGISEADLPVLLESLDHRGHMINDSDLEAIVTKSSVLSPNILEDFLGRALKCGATIDSSLGSSSQQIVQTYRDLLSNVTVKARIKEQKTNIQYIDIERPDQASSLRWIHLTHPNEETLQAIAQAYAIKYGDLKHCLKPENPPQSYRYGRYLVNRFSEISFVQQNEHARIKNNTVCAILGDSFLITISDTPSATVNRVRAEIIDNEVAKEEVASSNYIFCRLLGGSLHLNEAVIHKLEEACRMFGDRVRSEPPRPHLQEMMNSLATATYDVQSTLGVYPEVLESVAEPRNFFGVSKPRDALPRYATILRGMESTLQDAIRSLNLTRDSWHITQKELQNSILFKIALITGALAPPGVVMNFFGMNLPGTVAFSATFIATVIVSSLIVSAGLIAGLLFWRGERNF